MELFRITSSLEPMTQLQSWTLLDLLLHLSHGIFWCLLLYIWLSVYILKLIFIANDQTCSMNSVLLQSLSLDQNPAISNTDNLAGDVPAEFVF